MSSPFRFRHPLPTTLAGRRHEEARTGTHEARHDRRRSKRLSSLLSRSNNLPNNALLLVGDLVEGISFRAGNHRRGPQLRRGRNPLRRQVAETPDAAASAQE